MSFDKIKALGYKIRGLSCKHPFKPPLYCLAGCTVVCCLVSLLAKPVTQLRNKLRKHKDNGGLYTYYKVFVVVFVAYGYGIGIGNKMQSRNSIMSANSNDTDINDEVIHFWASFVLFGVLPFVLDIPLLAGGAMITLRNYISKSKWFSSSKVSDTNARKIKKLYVILIGISKFEQDKTDVKKYKLKNRDDVDRHIGDLHDLFKYKLNFQYVKKIDKNGNIKHGEIIASINKCIEEINKDNETNKNNPMERINSVMVYYNGYAFENGYIPDSSGQIFSFHEIVKALETADTDWPTKYVFDAPLELQLKQNDVEERWNKKGGAITLPNTERRLCRDRFGEHELYASQSGGTLCKATCQVFNNLIKDGNDINIGMNELFGKIQVQSAQNDGQLVVLI